MPKHTATKKLELFSLHCHLDENTVPDYVQFFRKIAHSKGKVRQLEDGDKLIALPVMRFRGADLVEAIFDEGPIGVSPLIFDARTEEEQIAPLAATAIVATRTHALFEVSSRMVIIEYNQRGAKSRDIADVLEAAARTLKLGANPEVELNPVADESFLSAIERFGVIKLANVRVAKSNVDWTDNYNHMEAVANDSNARTVELSVAAHRNDSLSKNQGLIRYIREMLANHLSAINGARVTGTRAGEKANTTISLVNYVQHQKVAVSLDPHGHVLSSDILKQMHSYMDAVRSQRS